MDVRVCLCTVCGIPASGKSSFCERLYQDLVKDYLVIYINYDNILLSQNTDEIKLHESLLLQNEDKTDDAILKVPRNQILQLVDILVQHLKEYGPQVDFERLYGLDKINKDILESFLSSCTRIFSNATEKCSDVCILLDDNFYFSSMRYSFYQMARQHHAGFCEIFMDSSTERAFERNKMRKGRGLVSDDVILNMLKKFEPPDAAKNQWERYSMKVTSEEATNVVFPMIKESFANPVPPIPRVDEREQALSQATCSKSLIHQADLVLRQCVRAAIASGKKSSKDIDIKLLSKQAMSAKEDILNGLKSGHFNIPFDDSSVQNASKNENCDLFKYIYDLFHEKLKAHN